MDLLQREKAKTSFSSAPLTTGEEIRPLNKKIGALTSELKKADNVTNFMESSEILPPHSLYAEDLESGFSSDVESKYKKMYEGGRHECICSFQEEGKGPMIQGIGFERQGYSE